MILKIALSNLNIATTAVDGYSVPEVTSSIQGQTIDAVILRFTFSMKPRIFIFFVYNLKFSTMRKWVFKTNVILACICAVLVIVSAVMIQSTLLIVLACIVTVCAIVTIGTYFKFIAGKPGTG